MDLASWTAFAVVLPIVVLILPFRTILSVTVACIPPFPSLVANIPSPSGVVATVASGAVVVGMCSTVPAIGMVIGTPMASSAMRRLTVAIISAIPWVGVVIAVISARASPASIVILGVVRHVVTLSTTMTSIPGRRGPPGSRTTVAAAHVVLGRGIGVVAGVLIVVLPSWATSAVILIARDVLATGTILAIVLHSSVVTVDCMMIS